MSPRLRAILSIGVTTGLMFYMAYGSLLNETVESLSSRERSFFNFIADIINVTVENIGSIPAALLFVSLGLANAYWAWKKMKKSPVEAG
ncbi:MAG: hypothetical protein V7776_12050 [Halopseudomonas aestusnigri]